jgi:hypothetical protein
VSNFLGNQQFEGYATYEKIHTRGGCGGVVILWRVVLKITKLPGHSMWQMVLHNIEANKRANVTPIILHIC